MTYILFHKKKLISDIFILSHHWSSIILSLNWNVFRNVRRFRRGRKIFGAVSQRARYVCLLKDRLVCDCETHRPRSEKRQWYGRGFPEVRAAQRDVLTDRDPPLSIHCTWFYARSDGTFAILSASTPIYRRVKTEPRLDARSHWLSLAPTLSFSRRFPFAPRKSIWTHLAYRSHNLSQRLPRFGKKRSIPRSRTCERRSLGDR